MPYPVGLLASFFREVAQFEFRADGRNENIFGFHTEILSTKLKNGLHEMQRKIKPNSTQNLSGLFYK
jgi:hypothetical protein